jgi:hypothetical protein
VVHNCDHFTGPHFEGSHLVLGIAVALKGGPTRERQTLGEAIAANREVSRPI